MYRSLLIAACISLLAAAAFANDPLPYLTGPANARGGGGGYDNTDDVLVENLCTSSSQIVTGIYGARAQQNSWVAIDYTPSSAVRVTKLSFHYAYYQAETRDTLEFRLYRGTTPRAASLVRSWNVNTSGYSEARTGWLIGNRGVWRSEVNIPAQELVARTRYWIAFRSGTTSVYNALYWILRRQCKEDMAWWYWKGVWNDVQMHDPYIGIAEQSYRIEGVLSGIAPTSFGKIKTLFH